MSQKDYNSIYDEPEQESFLEEDNHVLEELTEEIRYPLTLRSTMPEKHIVTNSKLDHTLNDLLDSGLQTEVEVGKFRGKHTFISVFASNEDSTSLEYSKAITEFDKSVHDAVVSFWYQSKKNGNPCVLSADTIYRIMVSDNSRNSVRQNVRDAIDKSIRKLRATDVTIKYEQIAKQKGLVLPYDLEEYRLTGHLLEARKIMVKSGGHQVEAYQIFTEQEPLLYKYGQMMKQVVTLDPQLLSIHEVKNGEIGEPIKNSPRRIVIRSYLMRRLIGIKGGANHRIRMSTLLSEIAKSENKEGYSKTEKQRIRAYIVQVLDYWKAKGMFYDYSFDITRSGELTGIDILPKPMLQENPKEQENTTN